MDESKEGLLSQINKGRTAHIILHEMTPIFKEVEDDLVSSLKSCFRTGKYSELVLACHVAQLVALDDLKVKLKGVAAQGDGAAEILQEEKPLDEYID